ncbi:hypothetical protein Ahy_A02g005056 isoform D [Arachis hypogaea]|uniref:Beta-glucosidase n=1 Tax=Arachis hypogaea TaxID=3818 RepID=A0A445E5P3_ARAHY|nr:hypothetical protein Ahy_A02g005056 isoform D [Arachis hypogaea]
MMEPKTCYSTILTLKLITFLLLNFTLRKLSAYENYYSRDDFPHDFIFGSATTAYQVEGAANEDGRTPSIWDTFAHDDGRGPVNPKGLEYYNNLINELISNGSRNSFKKKGFGINHAYSINVHSISFPFTGIQPHVTLHNFDLPQVLEDEYGGWVSRKIIRDFTNYADVCFREFGDRVLYWTTINEPNVFAIGGYDSGATPPRRCSPPFCYSTGNKGNSTIEPYLAVHNILLSHSSAARLYRRKKTNMDLLVYQSLHLVVIRIMEPLVRGDYPVSMKRNAGSRIPAFTSRESEQIKGSADFIGVIHYYNINVTDNPDALNNNLRDYNMDIAAVLYFELFSNEEIAVTPWKLVEELNKLKLLYGNPPLFIYENGQRTNSNSSLQDVTRVNYLYGYIGAVLDALRDGSNIKGYFVWSFMDVFELLDGYESSFGLYYVDRNDPELKRYPKLSAKWYNKFLKGGSTSIVGDLQQLNKDPSHMMKLEPYLSLMSINIALKLTLLLLLCLNFVAVRLVLSADEYNRLDFPTDFIFGSGTSAYQWEGAVSEDGRTPSIWDTYAHAGFAHGDTGDIACDGYHKYKEDVKLMMETGLDAYTLSISWSRLIPRIQPHVTLHNFDLPQALEDEYGGWVSPKIIRDFTNYADVCFREFGDRVLYWNTVNEPNVFTIGGYDQGTTPPTRCSPPFCQKYNSSRGDSTTEPYLAVHHILLSHSSAVRLYRRKYKDKQHGFIGIAVYSSGLIPANDADEDQAATQRARARIPTFSDRESAQLKGSCDFIGMIFYNNLNVTDNSVALKRNLRDYGTDMAAQLIFTQALFSNEEYPVTPWTLCEELNIMKTLYGNPPIFIYENGQRTQRNSSLQDVTRVEYLHGYIGAVLDSIRDDPKLKRYPKLSAEWYGNFLKGGKTSVVGAIELEKDPSSVSVGHLFQ